MNLEPRAIWAKSIDATTNITCPNCKSQKTSPVTDAVFISNIRKRLALKGILSVRHCSACNSCHGVYEEIDVVGDKSLGLQS